MQRNAKLAVALEILAKTRIRRGNYAPPLFRLLWRLGFNVPPPHFIQFGKIAFAQGFYMALFLGLWLRFVSKQGIFGLSGLSPVGLIGGATLGGIILGLLMAGYYSHSRKKYHLPEWENLEPKP